MGWIGVDLDGTLAHYDRWRGYEHVGEPVPEMTERVRKWLKEGKEVRIFTARGSEGPDELEVAQRVIHAWTQKHFGRALPVTNVKDYHMVELWDDRCKQVVKNKGISVEKWLCDVLRELNELREKLGPPTSCCESETQGEEQ